jgi:cyclohexadieny/prephenate dehydrogenase
LSAEFERIAVLGIGLIGSSICHAVKKFGVAKDIVGHAKSADTRKIALELGLVSKVFENPADAVKGADLVILCAPIGVCGAIAAAIGPAIEPGAIVTDVGSVKGAILRDCAPHIPEHAHFIPGHPIAGTEQSGPRSGFANLFQNRWCVLTPLPDSDETAVRKLEEFWTRLGSKVDRMSVEHHDLVLAMTSHLPHLIAYNSVATAADLEEVTQSEVIKFSAGGFRDLTRIAASDPTMWRDVFLNNREAVLEMLGRFMEELSMLQRAIRWGDGETLFNLFSRAREIRKGIIAAGQDTAAPDFGRDPSHKG